MNSIRLARASSSFSAPALAAAAAVLLLLPACQHAPEDAGDAGSVGNAEPLAVDLVAVEQRDWPLTVRAQGNLIGDEHAEVGVKVAGRIEQVVVDLGSVVRAGDVLARLETEEFDLGVQQAEAQLQQARAALGLKPGDDRNKLDPLASPLVMQEQALRDEARLNSDRARQLIEKNVITTADFDAIQAALRVAEARYASALNDVGEQIALLAVREAELAVARQSQSDAVIHAPFSGVVQQRHVAPGVYLNVGESVVSLVRTDPLRFRAPIPERQTGQLQVGQSVRLWVEGRTEPVEARLSRISPALDLSNRSLIVEADVANPNSALRSGLFAEAEIEIDAGQRVLAVPAHSIVEFAGVEKVWLVHEDQAVDQRIRTGRRSDQWVEILEGLKDGDRIVAQGERGRAGPIAAVGRGDSGVAGGGAGLVGGQEVPPVRKAAPALSGG